MTRAILVICDGLRDDLVTPEACPHISEFAATACRFRRQQAVFPSVTRVSVASIATGCRPARHGLQGNKIALDEGAGLVVRDAGKPDFREQLRRATGRTLHAPTLAERLAEHGGVIAFANGSPGAAYLHDPDGFGEVHHRAGSFGPGLVDLAPLSVVPGAKGDRPMTEQFCTEILGERQPALAVLWLSEPDRTAHDFGLGSPEHRAAITTADGCVGLVVEAARRLSAAGEDLLLVVGADHGMETIERVVEPTPLLVAAGLKESSESTDVVVVPQGSAGLIYLSEHGQARQTAIADWLRGQDWVDRLFVGDQLADAHLGAANGLAIAFGASWSNGANEFGVPGVTCNLEKQRQATHGGFGRYETNPFLIVGGGGFASGTTTSVPTSVIDLAPTILRHLGRPHDDLDGHPLPQTSSG